MVGPGAAAEDDEALRGLQQRLEQEVLDHPGPLLDQDRPEEPHQGLGPLQAPAGVEEQPGRVALHVLGRQAGEGQQRLEQALEAGLEADQLGGRPVPEPGQLLLDVADQLPGVARELLPDRVGGVDEQAERRDQAAVHAVVEHQGHGPPVGRHVRGPAPPSGAGPAPAHRRRRRPGRPGPSRRASASSSGSETGSNPDTAPRADSSTWRDSAPPSHAHGRGAGRAGPARCGSGG